MAEDNAPQGWWHDKGLALDSPSVDVSKLDPLVAHFLIDAAIVHDLLFEKALVITSGNDGNHVAGSAHYKNLAADIRSHDLDAVKQLAFHVVLTVLAETYGVAVFDERFTATPHWHVQTAASVGG